MTEKIWEVVIAGGGVAGLSAALMLGRARRRVLVIDHGEPRNRFAAHMHGLLGQDRADPARLIATGRQEAAGYDVEFAAGVVTRIDPTGGPASGGITATTAEGMTIRARAAVIATGISDDLPDLPGLAPRWGTSVLHCPYCHGWEVRDRVLGVLATSPLGLHQAELVRQWSDQVVFFTAGLGELPPEAARRLRARGVQLVPDQVVEVLGDGLETTGVRTATGRIVPVDAIFTAGTLRPHDQLVAHLGLDRAQTPIGSFLAVDPMGRTSHDRIWAVGNVANPMANVPAAISAGAMAGAAINAALVTAEFDAAEPDLIGFWEARYAGSGQIWSGQPNGPLVAVASELAPGHALDLGCGEGADAIWLAQQGWQVTGIDISPTALARATAAAADAGIPTGRIRWLAGDLAELLAGPPTAAPAGRPDEKSYDLVTASFLHSPVEIHRTDLLRRAADLVAPGGHLLIVSHGAFPPWAAGPDRHEHHFLSPAEEIAQLGLPEPSWQVRIAETRTRPATGPNGESATLADAVVLLHRT